MASSRIRHVIAALLTVSVTALLASSAGAATSAPSGTYAVTISSAKPASLDGTWKLHLVLNTNMNTYGGGRGGSFTLSRNGKLMASGPYSIAYSTACSSGEKSCNTIQFTQLDGPQRCPPTPVGGVYEYAAAGTRLVLKPIFETCSLRHVVLSSHPLMRSK